MEGIFNRMGTGGTGGGSRVESYGATKTELFSATDNYAYEGGINNTGANRRTQYDLTDDYDNYDYLIFHIWRRYGGVAGNNTGPTYAFLDAFSYIFSIDQLTEIYEQDGTEFPHKVIIIPGWQGSNEWRRIKFAGTNKRKLEVTTVQNGNANNSIDTGGQAYHFFIDKIYGIKLNTLIEPNSNNNSDSNNINNTNINLNSDIKSITWTGTGTKNQTLYFPEKPFMVLGFTQDSDPVNGERYQRSLIPFICTQQSAVLTIQWSDSQITATSSNTNQFRTNYYTTINGNNISWTAVDAGQALNISGVVYTLYYI